MHILIVEDDPDGADMVQMMLNSAGVETLVVGTAEAALTALNASPEGFNAVIVDLALPGMDGLQLLQVIRKTPSMAQLPLVAVTAYHTPEMKVRMLDAGFDGYFAKPLDTTLFVQSLERLLG
jgi:DNA-binding response OmpR family regulator